MHKELKKIYGNLLDCHIANLYSFYFKLYKYEQYFQKKANLDISSIVDQAIDVVNAAINTSEVNYGGIGKLPELSMTFLTDRSTIDHHFSPYSQRYEVLDSLAGDQASIEKTLELTIKYSDSLKYEEDAHRLMASKDTIHETFEHLKVVLQ
jgi:hypothetical protein